MNQEKIIKNILDYPMEPILKRCQKDYCYTDEDIKILERELKRYFALTTINKENGMYSKDVDKLWHTFILFTREYANFCKSTVNHFIHHIPETDTIATPETLEKSRRNFQAFVKNYEELFHEEVHPIWFLDIYENENNKL